MHRKHVHGQVLWGVRAVCDTCKAHLFPTPKPDSSAPRASLEPVEASQEWPGPPLAPAHSPRQTTLSLAPPQHLFGVGGKGHSLGCFLLASPPSTFEASHSTPLYQARSLVKVTQSNMVKSAFHLPAAAFQEEEAGGFTEAHGGRSKSRAGTCPTLTPTLLDTSHSPEVQTHPECPSGWRDPIQV